MTSKLDPEHIGDDPSDLATRFQVFQFKRTIQKLDDVETLRKLANDLLDLYVGQREVFKQWAKTGWPLHDDGQGDD